MRKRTATILFLLLGASPLRIAQAEDGNPFYLPPAPSPAAASSEGCSQAREWNAPRAVSDFATADHHPGCAATPALTSVPAGCAPQSICGSRTCCPQRPCAECLQRRVCVEECPPVRCQPQPQSMPYQAPAGVFAAPAPTGEVAGESSSLGIRGFAVRFPAFTLELPTIQLPSCVRYRRDAEMLISESRARYVTGPPALYAQVGPGGQVAPAGAYAAAQPPRQGCENDAAPRGRPYAAEASRLDEIQKLERELLQREQEIERLRQDVNRLNELEECVKRLMSQQASAGGTPATPPGSSIEQVIYHDAAERRGPPAGDTPGRVTLNAATSPESREDDAGGSLFRRLFRD